MSGDELCQMNQQGKNLMRMIQMSDKCYCEKCKYLYGLSHFTIGASFCTKLTKYAVYSEYNGQLIAKGELLDIKNNKNGNCEYFEPNRIERFIRFIRQLFDRRTVND